MNVVIIGFGNIGFRHYQSLKKSSENIRIFIYDLNPEQYSKVSDDTELITLNSLANLPKSIFLLISATTSMNRYNHLTKIMSNSLVSNIILEKMTFQKKSIFSDFQKKIRQLNIKTWVNCPKREWDSYVNLQDLLKTEKVVSFSVNGGNWNLASNAIHFLDLLLFLTTNKLHSINMRGEFLNHYVDSKRSGYYEVFGKLKGKLNDTKFIIESSMSNDPIIVTLMCASGYRYIIDETNNTLTTTYQDQEKSYYFKTYLQSNLTQKYFEKLRSNQTCNLPEYPQNSKIQIKIIEEILSHQKKYITEDEFCLIS